MKTSAPVTIEGLQAELAAERGEPGGGLPGWEWTQEYSGWLRALGPGIKGIQLRVLRSHDHAGRWCWDVVVGRMTQIAVSEDSMTGARAAMAACESAARDEEVLP